MLISLHFRVQRSSPPFSSTLHKQSKPAQAVGFCGRLGHEDTGSRHHRSLIDAGYNKLSKQQLEASSHLWVVRGRELETWKSVWAARVWASGWDGDGNPRKRVEGVEAAEVHASAGDAVCGEEQEIEGGAVAGCDSQSLHQQDKVPVVPHPPPVPCCVAEQLNGEIEGAIRNPNGTLLRLKKVPIKTGRSNHPGSFTPCCQGQQKRKHPFVVQRCRRRSLVSGCTPAVDRSRKTATLINQCSYSYYPDATFHPNFLHKSDVLQWSTNGADQLAIDRLHFFLRLLVKPFLEIWRTSISVVQDWSLRCPSNASLALQNIRLSK